MPVPDDPRDDPDRPDGRSSVRALPEYPRRIWRERHRLDPLRHRPHGFRIPGPIPRLEAQDAAERILAPPVQGHIPIRPRWHQIDRGYGSRNADVGFRLPASRRCVAGIKKIHRRAVQSSAGRGDLQDDLRERRQVLRPDQLTPPTAGRGEPPPHPAVGPDALRVSGPSRVAPADAPFCRRKTGEWASGVAVGTSADFVQQMQEQSGGIPRRARGVRDRRFDLVVIITMLHCQFILSQHWVLEKQDGWGWSCFRPGPRWKSLNAKRNCDLALTEMTDGCRFGSGATTLVLRISQRKRKNRAGPYSILGPSRARC